MNCAHTAEAHTLENAHRVSGESRALAIDWHGHDRRAHGVDGAAVDDADRARRTEGAGMKRSGLERSDRQKIVLGEARSPLREEQRVAVRSDVREAMRPQRVLRIRYRADGTARGGQPAEAPPLGARASDHEGLLIDPGYAAVPVNALRQRHRSARSIDAH